MCVLHCCPFFASSRLSLCLFNETFLFMQSKIPMNFLFCSQLTVNYNHWDLFSPPKPSYPDYLDIITELELWGLPFWLSWWNICLQCGRSGFDPSVGKSPWRRERLPTPVFWPGAFHGLYSPWGHKDLDMTEWLSLSFSLSFFQC